MKHPFFHITEGIVRYGATQLLRVPQLHIEKGQLALLQGANGTGKTSLFHALMGAGPLFSGQVFLMDKQLDSLPANRRAQAGIRLLPQGRHIFGRLNDHQHRELAQLYLGGQNGSHSRFAVGPINTEKRTSAAAVFSGGEAKLLLLDSLLTGDFRLLLLDEPFAGLESTALSVVCRQIEISLKKSRACFINDHTGFVKQHFQVQSYEIVRSQHPDFLFEVHEEPTQ